MFIMCRGLSISCSDCPSILLLYHHSCSQINHGFNTNGHPFYQFHSRAFFPIIGDFRFFMKVFSNSVSNQIPNNRITILLNMILNSPSNITNSFSGYCLLNPFVKWFFCYPEQIQNCLINLTNSKRKSRIPIITVHNCSTINWNNITTFQLPVSRNSMYHLLICRYAQCCRKAFITFESRHRSIITDKLFSYLIQWNSCYTGFDVPGYLSQCFTNK